jgi:hypothetical protein
MLKALASPIPGFLQPWDLCTQRLVTLKELANGCAEHLQTLSEFARYDRLDLKSTVAAPGIRQPFSVITLIKEGRLKFVCSSDVVG